MSDLFLDKIIAKTRKRVAGAKEIARPASVELSAKQVRLGKTAHSFWSSLGQSGRTNIIAEIKRASPSKGVINAGIDVADVARAYQSGGAAAISVLTETEYFGGSLADLELVSQISQIPVLRKDFMIDEYQIYEAAAYGADAILLIVAALTEAELVSFQRIARDELGMDALVEVHSSEELETARRIGANLIGVNNRNLKTLDVSLDVSRQLIGERPPRALMIAESGISTRNEIDELRGLGFDGFLIGETLMRTGDPSAVLKAWI